MCSSHVHLLLMFVFDFPFWSYHQFNFFTLNFLFEIITYNITFMIETKNWKDKKLKQKIETKNRSELITLTFDFLKNLLVSLKNYLIFSNLINFANICYWIAYIQADIKWMLNWMRYFRWQLKICFYELKILKLKLKLNYHKFVFMLNTLKFKFSVWSMILIESNFSCKF